MAKNKELHSEIHPVVFVLGSEDYSMNLPRIEKGSVGVGTTEQEDKYISVLF